ncbi:GNAT family N-acetyltransferase [Chryseobacterium lathyri]|uniref:GNAT family N-acetyltransferase n=1 Tax=Chryseobacterium lathyri TaxID=395933 RepID=UPI002780782D|nr:N-acetyltransferase [Chryseobacterium lathyri]MDQ0065832.1 ribosomal protein S18 acetylase RimI-like enzyme [Chryseobacterium lathyri]
MKNLVFNKIEPGTDIPYELLLLADETVEAINQYIFDCSVYLLNDSLQNVAVMALHPNGNTELEIKNIAVIESCRNQGIGSILIDKVKEIAKENNYTTLTVGTSDTGFQQIRFYENNGFVKKGIRKDFFINHYPFPIYENGLQMRDMVVLSHDLSE